MKKILVHSCCAVCFSYPSQFLKLFGYEPVCYFYNPNIFPDSEYVKRLEELKKYCKKYNFELIVNDYSPREFYDVIKGLENEPERGLRCEKCFALRLEKTAQKAKELAIEYFTTSLSISPHKDFDAICKAARLAEEKYGVEFKDYNFKKNNGFKVAMEIARFNNMYKQTYCGCEFSMRKEAHDAPVQN